MRIYLVNIFLLLFFLLADMAVCARENKTTGKSDHINCFVYHRFGDNRYPSTNISLEDFRKQLEFLKKNNYHVLTMGKALDLLDKNSLPKNAVVLTVDDGYKSFFENAMPLLREFGFPATLFINTRQFGSGDFLSIQQIKQIQKEGIEIGNHSHSHAHFVNLATETCLDSFRNDLEISQKIFREQLGFQPQLFAYPYGEYIPEMQDVLKDFGFTGATAQKSGVIATFSDRFALPRFPMAGSFIKIENFKQKAQMKALPVKILNAESPLLDDNTSPQLKLKVMQPELINLNQIQFFADGKKQNNIEIDNEKNIISVKATFSLNTRRMLYTITAPSQTIPLKWYWFSYLWINSSIEE